MNKTGKENEISIRVAAPEDAEALLEIYAPYVEKTAISFECSTPSVDDFRNRIITTLNDYPYIVAERDGKIVGYCYAHSFHSREAYNHSVETSIYVSGREHGHGIGTALYKELEKTLIRQNVYVLFACCTYSDRDDDYLPKTSPIFHEHLGYRLVGEFKDCGYKFGRWYGVLWLEKVIAERPQHPQPFIPFSECR